MNELKLVLKNGERIDLQEFSLPLKIIVLCETKEEMLEIWNNLSEESLESIEIQADGTTQMRFRNVSIAGVQSVVNSDGSMTVHFYMNGETEVNADDESDNLQFNQSDDI